jgi:hypothetical protein
MTMIGREPVLLASRRLVFPHISSTLIFISLFTLGICKFLRKWDAIIKRLMDYLNKETSALPDLL